MERSIASILEKEYYLEKVLFHVIDDGIRKFRQVSHKWNNVCKNLPAKVQLQSINNISKDNWILLIDTTFRNVTSFQARLTKNWWHEEGWNEFCHTIHIIMSSFPKLNHIDLWLSESRIDKLIAEYIRRPWNRLDSICLSFPCDKKDFGRLRYFTNLKHLEVYIKSLDISRDTEPFNEFTNLRSLILPSSKLLTNQKGEMLFLHL